MTAAIHRVRVDGVVQGVGNDARGAVIEGRP
jgi:hypothetical protein